MHSPHELKVYYVYFLTEDTTSGLAPAVPHAAAVLFSEKTGVKLVRQITLGEPGYTIIKATCVLTGLTVFEFIHPSNQKRFKVGVAKALGQDIKPSDVEITDIEKATQNQIADMEMVFGGDGGGDGDGGGGGAGAGAKAGGAGGHRRLVVADVALPAEESYEGTAQNSASKAQQAAADAAVAADPSKVGGVAVTFSIVVRGHANSQRITSG